MQDPTFDIFSGRLGESPIWIASVDGLSNARARMHDIAARTPGQYFVYSFANRLVVAETETLAESQPALKAKSGAA